MVTDETHGSTRRRKQEAMTTIVFGRHASGGGAARPKIAALDFLALPKKTRWAHSPKKPTAQASVVACDPSS
jgi:hypothetical protein